MEIQLQGSSDSRFFQMVAEPWLSLARLECAGPVASAEERQVFSGWMSIFWLDEYFLTDLGVLGKTQNSILLQFPLSIPPVPGGWSSAGSPDEQPCSCISIPLLFHSLALPSPSPRSGGAPTSLAGSGEAAGLQGATQVQYFTAGCFVMGFFYWKLFRGIWL